MSGKIIAIFLAAIAVIGGVSMYWLQVYAFYDPVEVPAADLAPEGAAASAFEARAIEAIDATSSPIRFRACFETETAPGDLAAATPYPDAIPLTAPFWFDCFDAEAIGTALATGDARAFLVTRNIEYGVDRVVALTGDGRGYAWHQLNNCGDLAYDGSPRGEACPPREDD